MLTRGGSLPGPNIARSKPRALSARASGAKSLPNP
jgi:hypothetical protein